MDLEQAEEICNSLEPINCTLPCKWKGIDTSIFINLNKTYQEKLAMIIFFINHANFGFDDIIQDYKNLIIRFLVYLCRLTKTTKLIVQFIDYIYNVLGNLYYGFEYYYNNLPFQVF